MKINRVNMKLSLLKLLKLSCRLGVHRIKNEKERKQLICKFFDFL